MAPTSTSGEVGALNGLLLAFEYRLDSISNDLRVGNVRVDVFLGIPEIGIAGVLPTCVADIAGDPAEIFFVLIWACNPCSGNGESRPRTIAVAVGLSDNRESYCDCYGDWIAWKRSFRDHALCYHGCHLSCSRTMDGCIQLSRGWTCFGH